jgi:hypothetical protein
MLYSGSHRFGRDFTRALRNRVQSDAPASQLLSRQRGCSTLIAPSAPVKQMTHTAQQLFDDIAFFQIFDFFGTRLFALPGCGKRCAATLFGAQKVISASVTAGRKICNEVCGSGRVSCCVSTSFG